MAKKEEGKIQPLDSEKQLENSERATETSSNLSRNVSLELLDLMKRVNGSEVTPESVNAACNCASQIHKILRLNFDMHRQGL